MEKIILINGQGGVGKSTTGKTLMRQLDSSAYVGVDSLVSTNPWEFGGKTDDLAITNAISLINNFTEAGFKNIIIGGLTRNQQLLDIFLEKLNKEVVILFVWLRASKEARMERKKGRNRDEADSEKHFDYLDKIMPDIDSIQVKNGKAIFIDTSSKTVERVVEDIKLAI